MHLTLRQLMVFAYVARHESYTRAAESLHLTQPAVSMQVRQLEEVDERARVRPASRSIPQRRSNRCR